MFQVKLNLTARVWRRARTEWTYRWTDKSVSKPYKRENIL